MKTSAIVSAYVAALLLGASAASAQDTGGITPDVLNIDSVLWTRFEATPEGYAAHVHVDGPKPDDVVIVTDGKVVRALAEGSLDAVKAEAHGLLRLYRQPDLHEKVRSVLMNASVATRPASETLGTAAMQEGKQ